MPTAAETYASKFSTATAAKPAAFTIDGRDVALVTPEGNLALVGGAALTPAQAESLRQWIKATFIAGGAN